MLQDSHYLNSTFAPALKEHQYGSGVYILDSPYHHSMLAKLCSPQCEQPLLQYYLETSYRFLAETAVNTLFPRAKQTVQTRMALMHPNESHFEQELIDTSLSVVSVNLARAGTSPSQICYELLTHLFAAKNVRQDHISINRKTNSESQVIGTDLGGVKIGGGVENAIVLFPDPMGATGSTIKTALEIYEAEGRAKLLIGLHLIVTPEYLRTRAKFFPHLKVFALRIDRGLSSPKILESNPGAHWENEKGLNEKQYIVPGAGGLGEVINNAFV